MHALAAVVVDGAAEGTGFVGGGRCGGCFLVGREAGLDDGVIWGGALNRVWFIGGVLGYVIRKFGKGA